MMRAPWSFAPRLFLAILSAFLLAAPSWAQATQPGHPAVFATICSDGEVRTVRLDNGGGPAPSGQDCRDCPACFLPLSLNSVPFDVAGRPEAWLRHKDILPRKQAAMPVRATDALSRAPPATRHPA